MTSFLSGMARTLDISAALSERNDRLSNICGNVNDKLSGLYGRARSANIGITADSRLSQGAAISNYWNRVGDRLYGAMELHEDDLIKNGK